MGRIVPTTDRRCHGLTMAAREAPECPECPVRCGQCANQCHGDDRAERRVSARYHPKAAITFRNCYRTCGLRSAQVGAGLADVCWVDRRPAARWASLWGGDAERFGVGPAVMLGQNLADVAGPVGEGAVAELAAGDRQMGDGHREAVGTWRTHRLPSCQPCLSGHNCMLARTHDSRHKRVFSALGDDG